MLKNTNRFVAVLSTATLGLVMAASTMTTPAMAGKKMAAKPMAGKASVAQGKSLSIARCAKCHGADENGIEGFSPGITTKQELKHYTKAQFERVLKTGITNDGKMVHKPMPVFGFNAVQSDSIYLYLKTLK